MMKKIRAALAVFLAALSLVGLLTHQASAYEGQSGQETMSNYGINAEAVLASGLTGEGVTVAVIDSGLNVDDMDHHIKTTPGRFFYWREETDGRYLIYTGCKPCNYYSSGDTKDDIGHGTMMASIITDIAPNATIMPVRCFTSLPGYGECSSSNMISSIDYAVEHGADIICMSFGTQVKYATVGAAVKRAVDAGCVLIAAVGNDGTATLRYPAAYDGVIGVGATDSQGKAASYSQHNDSVDIYAPGKVCWRGKSKSYSGTGTSFSTAIVVGAAALAMEAHPDMTGDELLEVLLSSAGTVDGQESRALNVERMLKTAGG